MVFSRLKLLYCNLRTRILRILVVLIFHDEILAKKEGSYPDKKDLKKSKVLNSIFLYLQVQSDYFRNNYVH